MRALIVIPARWGSTRLPGKPLVPIAGVPLLTRVIHLARLAAEESDTVLVATDDVRIKRHCSALGQRCVLTDPALTSGTERVLASVDASGDVGDVIVNLQGDAPFVPPRAIRSTIDALRKQDREVATPVVELGWDELDVLREHKHRSPFSGTTCICAEDGRALWFSKHIIPAIRDETALRQAQPFSPVLRHLGLYAYRPEALRLFVAAGATKYERLEQLEQLRFLELGLRVDTVRVVADPVAMGGIDTPHDVAVAETLIARRGDPMRR